MYTVIILMAVSTIVYSPQPKVQVLTKLPNWSKHLINSPSVYLKRSVIPTIHLIGMTDLSTAEQSNTQTHIV